MKTQAGEDKNRIPCSYSLTDGGTGVNVGPSHELCMKFPEFFLDVASRVCIMSVRRKADDPNH
jgi:hypothetical protein